MWWLALEGEVLRIQVKEALVKILAADIEHPAEYLMGLDGVETF